MRPEDLERAVDKGEIAPLYFIYGEEDFLLERSVQRLLGKLVAADFRDFNFTQYFGKESRAEQIIENAMTLPMFADRRVIHVKRAEELPADALELFTAYLAAPSPDCCILFQATKIDLRRKFFTELKKADLLVEFKKLRDEHLPGFVRKEAEACGRRIDPAAAELLVYYTGNNLRELVSQMEKLVAFIGERQQITVDDVREIASDTKTDTVFELANAMGNRDLARAHRQLQLLLRDADAPYMLIGALARHFRQLCLIREMQEKKIVKSEIGKALKINPYFLDGMLGQARRFRLDEFPEFFSQMHDADVGIKSGGRQATLLEMLLYTVCRQPGKLS
jgi:DNA polymerase-3 subunit delta